MERHLVGPNCREQYLNDTPPARRALQNHGIYSAGISDLRPPYSIERAPSSEHVFLMTTSGQGTLRIADETHSLTPGSLCFLPAGLTYAYHTDGHWEKSWFHLQPIDRWQGPTRIQNGMEWDEIVSLMQIFAHERVRNTKHSPAMLDSLARSLSILIERTLDTSETTLTAESRRRVERLRQLLYADPGQDWSVTGLAREFGASPRHLQSVVKQFYGCGVMEMVTQIRLERAIALLTTTHWKVEDIAQKVGYQNPFAFSRVFKRHTGLSPRHYRDNY